MDLSRLLHTSVTLVFGLLALLISTKIIGKIQLSQATPFHFISALVLGELLGNALYDKEASLIYILFSIALWTALMFTIEVTTQKFRKTRGFFEGKPSIIIQNGNINFEELKKNKLDLNEVLRMLREKGVFSVRQVEYGILESSGTITVLKKWSYENPTNQDLNVAPKPVHLPIGIISDGEILNDNLQTLGRDAKWVVNQLKAKGINDVNEVFYADWKQDEGLHVVIKNK